MERCKTIFFAILLIVGCYCLKGCAIPINKKFVHKPPLAKNVSKIVKGLTTKEDVLKYFGVPDIQADGSNSKVSPNHPLVQMYEEVASQFGLKYDLEKFLPYSSIDYEHEAFFYMEHRMKGFVVIPIGGGWGTYYRNKLLLFINKNKGVVDEFAYREEFKVD